MKKDEISLAQDTSNWITIIKKEAEMTFALNSVNAINKIEKQTENRLKGKNVLLKSVLDELKNLIATHFGTIRKIIEEEIISILDNKNTSDKEKTKLIYKLVKEDIKHSLNQDQWAFFQHIREKIWGLKTTLDIWNFTKQKLMNKISRAHLYAELKQELLGRAEIIYFVSICQGNLEIYDPTEHIERIVKNKEKILEDVARILKGSRTRKKRNLYDQLHLLSCEILTRESPKTFLIFSTKDTKIIKNSQKNNPFSFEIVSLKNTPEKINEITNILL